MKYRSARQTQVSELYLRMFFALAYGLLTFTALSVCYRNDFFCNRTSSFGFVAPVIALTIVVTALDSIASLCGRVLDHFPTPSGPHTLIAPVVCSAIVGFGLFYFPIWIFFGYGHYRFEGTIADVSCLFTEGYGMVFPYLAAPFFAILSLVRELILERALRAKQSAQISRRPV